MSELDDLQEEVTKLKQEVLTSSYELYKAIALVTPAIVVSLETNRILESTPKADVLFGYFENELPGLNIHDLIPGDVFSVDDPEVQQVGNVKGLKRDGSGIEIGLTLYPKFIFEHRAVIAVMRES